MKPDSVLYYKDMPGTWMCCTCAAIVTHKRWLRRLRAWGNALSRVESASNNRAHLLDPRCVQARIWVDTDINRKRSSVTRLALRHQLLHASMHAAFTHRGDWNWLKRP